VGKTEQKTYLVLLQRICARLLRVTLLFSNCLLLLMLVSHVVFLSCVSISACFFLFLCSVFRTRLYSLSVHFSFRCFRPVLVREKVHFWYGVKKNLRVPLVSLHQSLFRFLSSLSLSLSLSLSKQPLFFGAPRFI
jgi:hypothetical protein